MMESSSGDKIRSTCTACGNYIDEEDPFCANCGREAPAGGEPAQNQIESGFIGFDCKTCAASLTYDAEAQGLRCAFCGSVSLQRQPSATGRIRAEHYLPFEITRDAALRMFGRFIARGWFRPFGLKAEARVISMQAVYIPCWRFRAKTHTYYAGDSSKTPLLARAEWCPVFGERSGEVLDVLIPASGSLAEGEIADISPFDFARRAPYQREAIRAYVVEDFGLSRRGARPRARARMLEAERAVAAAAIPGRSRNVHVNPLFREMRSDPVLLPVWINAYRFREETFRFLVNGQSGKLVGRAPFSFLKLFLVVLAALGLGIIAMVVMHAA